MNLAESSARIALAAFLHDLGKLAERAGIDKVSCSSTGLPSDKMA